MWQSQVLVPALPPKSKLFTSPLCCWNRNIRMKGLGAPWHSLHRARVCWWNTTWGKSMEYSRTGGQGPDSCSRAIFVYWLRLYHGPEWYEGMLLPGSGQQHSSICLNHMCPEILLCPSASLVSSQLERKEKSCTRFNGPKGPCFYLSALLKASLIYFRSQII